MDHYKNRSHKKCRLLILTFAFVLTQSSYAVLITAPLPPRLSVAGTSGTITYGEVDGMIPVLGNSNQIVFGDINARYGDNHAWFTSVGAGLRQIVKNDMILGAYLFGDYNKTLYRNYYTVMNPGLEYLSTTWDGHVNGYFLLGTKTHFMSTVPGSQIGVFTDTYFAGHNEYDSLYNIIEDAGNGVDAQIGRTFSSLNKTRAFTGAYFFAPKYTSNITGVQVGFETPIKHKWASLEVRDSYDNINHNTFTLTLWFTMGGIPQTDTNTLSSHMLDRVQRHLGTLNTGDGIPSEKSAINTGTSGVVRNNIWFFNVNGAPTTVQGFQSCTYEHPCSGLAQTQIDAINTLANNANFYFTPGTYNNPAVGAGFNFYNGQNLFGRTTDYTQPASASNLPVINDSITLNGNNSVNNLGIVANSELTINSSGMLIQFQSGILVSESATGIVNINNSNVSSIAAVLNAAGVINNSAAVTVNLNNSAISSSIVDRAGGIAIGAGNVSSGNINVNSSTVNVSQSNTVNNFDIAFGVVNNENGIVNINNSTISVDALNGGLAASVLNNSTVGSGTINISNSTMSTMSDGNNLTAAVFNQANNVSGVGGTINIDGSTMTMNALNSSGVGAGIFNSAESTINLTNSTVSGSGDSGMIFGVFNSDPASTINLLNNIINVDLSGTATGMPIFNGGTFNNNGGNQCFQNGAPVPC